MKTLKNKKNKNKNKKNKTKRKNKKKKGKLTASTTEQTTGNKATFIK